MDVRKQNRKFIKTLHPDVRDRFTAFESECFESNLPIKIFSALRSWEQQAILYKKWKDGDSNIPASYPGNSFHNYGLAIDIYVYSNKNQTYTKDYSIYKKVAKIAQKHGIYWLGKKIRKEMHHFDVVKTNRTKIIKDLKVNYFNNKVDLNGYVVLDELREDTKEIFYKENWLIDIGNQAISYEENEKEKAEKKIKTKIVDIEKREAVGIWQIIKLVADQYSLSQNINDASISFNQGSLLNFIQKVIQKPWLQFFGDTVRDKYYFFARKEPFDYNGWVNLPTVCSITDDEVISDDLDWYDGDIFSWHQIIPRGSFLGQQDLIFAYVTAVFFEEYAEIWGSKPNIQISNYVNFDKINGKSSMLDKAIEDLRYMVESNMYLPFTRKGTIIISGNSSIKRGYKIRYLPTGEIFYVDSVSHRYNISDGGTEYITILQVSRGMKIEFVIAPEDRNTISYFNIISFDDPPPIKEKVKKTIKDSALIFYFDNDRNYLIDLNEDFTNNDTSSKKMQKQIEDFPNLRKKLYDTNLAAIKIVADYINKHQDAEQFICKGHIDSDAINRTSLLSKQRANTIKNLVIEEYLKKYNKLTRKQLENKIKVEVDKTGNVYAAYDENGKIIDYSDISKTDNERELKIKAYERHVAFIVKPYEKIEEKEKKQKGVNWSVNRKVFHYFLNRKQF